jgi:hypothetical protein
VLVNTVNFDHSFGGPLKDLLNVVDCRSGFFLRANQANQTKCRE